MTQRTRASDIVRPSDWVFAGACIAAACILAFFLWTGGSGSDDAVVVIRQYGQIVETVPLDEYAEVRVEGAYTTVFTIRDGAVTASYANCPGKDCMRTGTVRLAGQSIVCVPNAASATIEGGRPLADAYTG